jgi:hypothetical protein
MSTSKPQVSPSGSIQLASSHGLIDSPSVSAPVLSGGGIGDILDVSFMMKNFSFPSSGFRQLFSFTIGTGVAQVHEAALYEVCAIFYH